MNYLIIILCSIFFCSVWAMETPAGCTPRTSDGNLSTPRCQEEKPAPLFALAASYIAQKRVFSPHQLPISVDEVVTAELIDLLKKNISGSALASNSKFGSASSCIQDLIVLPSKKECLVATNNSALCAFESADLKRTKNVSCHANATSLCQCSLGILSGHVRGHIVLRDPDDFSYIKELKGHVGTVNTIDYNEQYQSIASSSRDASVKIWDVASGSCRKEIKNHKKAVRSARFMPDEPKLVSIDTDSKIKCFDLENDYCCDTIKLENTLLISLSTIMHDIIAVGVDRAFEGGSNTQYGIRLFDMRALGSVAKLSHHKDWISCLVAAHYSPWLFSGSWDNSVALWDLRNMCQPIKLVHCEAPSSWIRGLDYCESNRSLYAGDAKGNIFKWDLANIAQIDYLTCEQSDNCINSILEVSPEEKLSTLYTTLPSKPSNT